MNDYLLLCRQLMRLSFGSQSMTRRVHLAVPFTSLASSKLQSFNDTFRTPDSNRQISPENVKVSKKGTADALFKECLDAIRQRRAAVSSKTDIPEESDKINKMSQDEIDIIKSIFRRLDPDKQMSPQLESVGGHIDFFWNPFQKVEDMKRQIAYEYNEYSKLVSAAEARKQKLLIRKSLKKNYNLYHPLSEENRKHFARQSSEPYPIPDKVSERFWDPDPNIKAVLKNRNIPITFRDLHILHHFVGENGLVLPRRITFASRVQQRYIFKAICVARRLALFPYDYKPSDEERIPIIDPLQYLADELTERYIFKKDRRAKAMIMVMMNKYSELNFMRYLRYEAQRNINQSEAYTNDNGFENILNKYKQYTYKHTL